MHTFTVLLAKGSFVSFVILPLILFAADELLQADEVPSTDGKKRKDPAKDAMERTCGFFAGPYIQGIWASSTAQG